ncbi:MAG TPA: PAS domain S-box protein [Planctomycetota bacterium]|nr:PAS domain S-box protein [Planctomycetota bacterium]
MENTAGGRLSAIRTLIVTNDYTLQVVLEEVLRARGHQTTYCNSTQAAWERCQAKLYDLILLDLLISAEDATRLCQCIRSLPESERCQLVVISGSAFGGDLPAALEAGADDYLTRPLDLRLLKVRIALSERHARAITARVEAEFTLRQSEKRFRALIENSLDGTVLLTAEGVALYATPSITRMLGWPLEEYVGRQTFELLHPDDVAEATRVFTRLISTHGGTSTVAIRTRHKNGTYRWLDCVGYNMLNEPSIRAIIANFRDITERKHAEETLRASEERYRNLVETSNDLIWAVDVKGCWTFLNRHATKSIFGYEPEEMLGRPFTDFETPEQAARDMLEFERIKRGERCIRYETVHLRKDGTPVYMSYNAIASYDAAGNVIGTAGTASDITRQKLAQERLRAGDERLRLALSAAGMGSWDVNLSNFETTWDEGSCRIFGFPGPEYTGTQDFFMQHIHPDDLPRMQQKFQEVIEKGEIFNVEFRFIRSDGTLRWVNGFGRTLPDSAGKIQHLFGVNVDITERKLREEEQRRMEQQVQHVQRLESLGIVAGGIAHDFNNLLVGILGNSDLALRDLTPGTPLFERLDDIRSTSQRAAELTRQMLAYSGHGQFVLEPFSLNDLLKQMSQLLQASISKKASLSFRFGESLARIFADVSQIRQIVVNLVTNASEALGESSGSIVVSTGTLKARTEDLYSPFLAAELPAGEYVFLEVTDTGSGMDEATLNRAFEPFFSTRFTGRGLGLAAVLGIVRGHKGSIQVRSRPGQGSTFKVLFPATTRETPEPRRPEPMQAGQAAASAATILLVDDEEVMRKVVKLGLEQFGYTVLTAGNGSEGVELFSRHSDQIDLVILDLTMPVMSGEEAYTRMRQIRPNLRAVLTSGYAEQDATSQFEGHNLAGFIQKPFRIETLAAKVRQALAR